MNKYIDYLTVKEYEAIEKYLKAQKEIILQDYDQEKLEGKTDISMRRYTEISFLLLKVSKIIKKNKVDKTKI